MGKHGPENGTPQDFPYWSARCPETPQKRDTCLKNEISMNFGNKFPPPLICYLNRTRLRVRLNRLEELVPKVVFLGGDVAEGVFKVLFHFEGSTLFGFGKRGLLEKGSFQKSPFSRDSGEFRDSRDSPDCGKQRRFRPFSRDSREFRDSRDSRDSSGEKTPFVMTPFSVPDLSFKGVFLVIVLGCPPKSRKIKWAWRRPYIEISF